MSDLIDVGGLDFGGAPRPSTAAKADAKPAATEIAIVQPRVLVAEQVFAPGALTTLLDDLEREARAEKVDISTEKGRKSLKSLVFRVARSKTALDDMGKALGADARKTIDRINADRRIAWDRLEGLGASIRKPLTDWENADKARIEAHQAAIRAIAGEPPYLDDPHTSAELRQRLDALCEAPAKPRDWQEFSALAADALEEEISATRTALEQVIAFEAEQAERARLVAEAAARAQAERDAQIKAQAEAAAAEAIAAAERRAAQAEQDRIDTQIAAAEEAEASRARAEQEAARAVATAQARRAAQDAAEAAAQVARAADMAHRRTINGEALDDLRTAGLTVEVAQAVITAIAQGKVRHVAIRY